MNEMLLWFFPHGGQPRVAGWLVGFGCRRLGAVLKCTPDDDDDDEHWIKRAYVCVCVYVWLLCTPGLFSVADPCEHVLCTISGRGPFQQRVIWFGGSFFFVLQYSVALSNGKCSLPTNIANESLECCLSYACGRWLNLWRTCHVPAQSASQITWFSLTSTAFANETQIVEFGDLIFHDRFAVAQLGTAVFVVARLDGDHCAVTDLDQRHYFEGDW